MAPRFLTLLALIGAAALLAAPSAHADGLPEYRLKAAFVYNFMAFAEWPSDTGAGLNLCILGDDPFGKEIDALQGKAIGHRAIALHRKASGESLKPCQAVFLTASTMDSLPRLLDNVRGRPVLTLADSAGAMRRGVMINMDLAQGKVSFEANLAAARASGLNLSSKLLRLATEVQQ